MAVILSLWFFAGSFVVETKNQAAYGISQALLWPKWWLRGLVSPALNLREREELELENEDLKAEIFKLKLMQPKERDDNYIFAKVYASSPFNSHGQIAINVGKKDGAKKGMAVTVGKNILLGQIDGVFENYSLVKTIFSAGWRLPVRIGEDEVEALLVGGPELKITMLINTKQVGDGDRVFATDKDIAYGLTIGNLKLPKRESEVGVFKEAIVVVSYNPSDLIRVWVLK